ncbi:MAG: integrase arm-type DNA-binding domain-containing protein, partial [Rhodospirillales bacterium]|nr:integrase arm-type DNA-binding domain-containing protein [Rhodospirillales bacterium]
MKLKDIQCRQAEPRDKPYRLSDGGGMYLEVMPNGSKYWRLKYRIHGKEKRYAIGVYPQTSLGEAREEREIAKKKIKGGIDPVSERKQEKRQAEENSANTFKAVALEWFDIQKDNWSEGYQQKILRIMEMNLFPFIGNAPIANIKPPDLLDCLRKVEKRGALDIAARTKQTAGMIFRYGIQTGKCEWNAADNLAGALKTKRTEHYSALDEKQLPSFLQALRNNEARLFERTRRAVWFSLYTFQRPGEIRQAEWSEIDWDKKEWHIAAHKMKMRRDHIVPLSDQAIEILKAQKEETGYL